MTQAIIGITVANYYSKRGANKYRILAKEKRITANFQKNVRKWDNTPRRPVSDLETEGLPCIFTVQRVYIQHPHSFRYSGRAKEICTATGSRLPVENFFVPCMVTERNTTSFMEKECTPERAICLAFVFKGTVIPPALPNRLISACLSMWTLKQYEGEKLLFSGFIVVSFDKAHDVVVCVEGNKILLYIVHKPRAGLIVPDIATVVKECLVTTMERISDFYQSTSTCLQDSALNQIPSDVELHRLAAGCDETTIRELAIHLGMTLQDWDTLRSNNARIEIVKYRILVNWREKYSERFSRIAKALTDMDLPVHTLCQVKRERRAETDIPLEYLERIPTDEILDKLAPQIGQVYFQLGTTIGLSIGTLENIQSNNLRDLAAQNREVLFAWREDRTVKPTIRVLVQALVNIGRGALCLQEILTNVDPNTLGSEEERGKCEEEQIKTNTTLPGRVPKNVQKLHIFK
ncbi:Hypothetical predicted protein [Mytilus galloprovincialis]|uniref:Death domain-containing protein n=1 Tax=Mytilus galloprovincialis TaxID=29158 RepID=A0A8B6BRM4_MYTGA|nr:Hypothetical predicted protein [Mytilus galloprovincialis]